MRKIVATAGICLGLFASSLSADALKNSLSKMIHEKETPTGMVDLTSLDRPSPASMRKTRSSTTVIAIVDGHKIRKKLADDYLSSRTAGKVSDFDLLPKKQRKRLVKELALPMLIANRAKKELSKEEKESLYISVWMHKKVSKTKVADSEVKILYDELKQKALEHNTTNNIIPPFESIKNKMKAKMIEKKIMKDLMKDVKVEVEAPIALPPMMIHRSSARYEGLK